MARRYPGPMLPQVMPLFYISNFSILKNLIVLCLFWILSIGLGVHWMFVPGLYGVWIITVIPHAFSHLLVDMIFKKEILTDWAGPVPNFLIVFAFFLNSFHLRANFGMIFSTPRELFENQPFLILAVLLYAFNLLVVFQHLFLPWPANDPDTGLVVRWLKPKILKQLTRT